MTTTSSRTAAKARSDSANTPGPSPPPVRRSATLAEDSCTSWPADARTAASVSAKTLSASTSAITSAEVKVIWFVHPVTSTPGLVTNSMTPKERPAKWVASR